MLAKWMVSLLVLVGICLSCAAQQEKTAFGELAVLVPKLAQLQDSFENTMPPGVSLSYKEAMRKGTPGKDLLVGYTIAIHGLPPDMVLRQLQWPVDRAKPMAGFVGITLKDDGTLICAGRTPGQCHSSAELDAPITFASKNPLAGEPLRFVFVGGGLRIPFSVVPNPIESEDKGCRISAIRLSAKFEVARVEGSGFPPNSDVHVQVTGDGSSGTAVAVKDQGETTALGAGETPTIRADAKGVVQPMTSLHNTTLQPQGETTVTLTNGTCAPSVHYRWGAF